MTEKEWECDSCGCPVPGDVACAPMETLRLLCRRCLEERLEPCDSCGTPVVAGAYQHLPSDRFLCELCALRRIGIDVQGRVGVSQPIADRKRALLGELGLSDALAGNELINSSVGGSIERVARSVLRPLLPHLRRDLLHVTSARGFVGIRESGMISPNDGSFPDTFPQSRNSYGRIRGAVALFDFESPTSLQFLDHFGKCEEFFTHHAPATFVLRIPRSPLVSRLISYDDATREVGRGPTKIPYVETWIAEPIPFDAVSEVIEVESQAPPSGMLERVRWKPAPPAFRFWKDPTDEALLERARKIVGSEGPEKASQKTPEPSE